MSVDIVAGIAHLVADTEAKTGRRVEGLRASARAHYMLIVQLKGRADEGDRVGVFSGIPFTEDVTLPTGTIVADIEPERPAINMAAYLRP